MNPLEWKREHQIALLCAIGLGCLGGFIVGLWTLDCRLLSNNGKELDRDTASGAATAVKVALLMLATRDTLEAGDMLRIEANDWARAQYRKGKARC